MHSRFARRLSGVLVLATAALAGCAGGDRRASIPEASVKPGINDEYFQDADIPTWQGRLEAESREIYAHREQLIAALPLARGMHVADVGAGTGLFTVLLAQAVGPGGRVYAQEIVPDFLDNIVARARAAHLSNVVTVLGQEKSAELPAASVDLVFVCDTYHHFEYPRNMLTSIRRALRPDGRLVVVDFERIEGVSDAWVLGHVRAGSREVIAEVEASGFRLLPDQPDAPFLRRNYLRVFAPH